MNKEKQIEEIAMTMCEKHMLWEGTQETCVEADKQCDNNCKWVILANTLYNAGYRKASKQAINADKKIKELQKEIESLKKFIQND